MAAVAGVELPPEEAVAEYVGALLAWDLSYGLVRGGLSAVGLPCAAISAIEQLAIASVTAGTASHP